MPLSFKPLLTPNWNGTDSYNDYWLYLVGRLKPGTTREQAAAALNSSYRSVVEEHAKTVKWRDAKRVERYRTSQLSVVEGRQGTAAIGTAGGRRSTS